MSFFKAKMHQIRFRREEGEGGEGGDGKGREGKELQRAPRMLGPALGVVRK